MQNSFRYLENVAIPMQPVPQTSQINFNPFTGYLALGLPIALSMILCGYLQWRSHLYNQQVKRLERIWQQDWNMSQGDPSEGYSNPL